MQAFALDTIRPADARGHIRPVDNRRDLGSIADLVELCFSDTLDPDSQAYLKQMRAAARASRLFAWTLELAEPAPNAPVTGFVWEVDGRLVGNLSLIPFKFERQRLYLIANVAVHPDYRRRGIGRQLTASALDYLKRRGTPGAWLHVRSDNPHAIHLYETLGFQERTRRTTWYSLPELPAQQPQPGLQLRPRRSADWATQRLWLSQMYPAMYAWHLPLDWQAFETGWWGAIYRFYNFTFPRHWTARQNGTLLGAVSRMPSDGHADNLFLAAPAGCTPEVIQALLAQARQDTPLRRQLTLNCAADLFPQAIQAAGFYAQQTLLWMEVRF